MYYKLDGTTPVKVTKEEYYEIAEKGWPGRRVGEAHLSNGRVSTVFLSIDHRHTDEGPPILFETMVFGGPLDETCERYCTWDEAAAGFKRMVEQLKAMENEHA